MEIDTLPTRRTRRAARAAALLLVTFLSGAAAGFAPSYFRREPPPENTAVPNGVRLRISDDLPPAFEELGLTTQQRAAVIQILADARPRTNAVLADVLPRLRAITDSVDAAMRAVLRPDQRERLTRLRGVHGPVLVIRRPTPGGGAPHVDTIIPRSRP